MHNLKKIASTIQQSYSETRRFTDPLTFIALLFFIIWQFVPNDNWQNFGLNAFTEILGIIVTIIFVDSLLDRQEQNRLLPLQVAAYDDVCLLTNRIISFWAGVYHHCVPEEMPTVVEDLFSEDSFDKIMDFLDLDTQPPVIPRRTWWQWLPEQNRNFNSIAERILERHMGHLEPNTYHLIHKLTTTTFLNVELISNIRAGDKQLKFPRPTNLGNSWFTTQEELEIITKLNTWCLQEQNRLKKSGFVDLRPITTLTHQSPLNPPPAMMKIEKRKRQTEELDGFHRNLGSDEE